LTIEIEEDRFQKAMRRAAKQISKQVNIPGFRKGKAPYDVILERFSEEVIRQEALDFLAEDVYREALEQEEIEPYGPGMLEEITFDPLTFELVVPLTPTVDLGAYEEYRLKHPEVRVYEKEIQEALENIQEQNAFLEPVERAAAMGDVATINLQVRAAGTELLDQEEVQTLLDPESDDPAPDFAEAVVGMEAGDTKTFTLAMSEDFPMEDLQGRDAEFEVELLEVHERILPDLDDDLARTVGKYDSLDELKAYVEEQLRQSAQAEADQEYTNQVIEALVEQAEVVYPPVMVEEQLDGIVEEVAQTVQSQAKLPLEDYLRFQDKTMDDLREDLTPQAEERLKRMLVLGEVVHREGIEIDEDEFNAQIEETGAQWGARGDEVRAYFRSEEGRRQLESRMLATKAVERLVAIAKGEGDVEEEEAEDVEPEEETEEAQEE
jgi:trigger factor